MFLFAAFSNCHHFYHTAHAVAMLSWVAMVSYIFSSIFLADCRQCFDSTTVGWYDSTTA